MTGNNYDLIEQLALDEKTYVNSQVALRSKSLTTGYLLAIFFGSFGLHRFYYGKTTSAITMLILGIFSFFNYIKLKEKKH